MHYMYTTPTRARQYMCHTVTWSEKTVNTTKPWLRFCSTDQQSKGMQGYQTDLKVHEPLCMFPLILTVSSEKHDHARQGDIVSVEVGRDSMVCIGHVVFHTAKHSPCQVKVNTLGTSTHLQSPKYSTTAMSFVCATQYCRIDCASRHMHFTHAISAHTVSENILDLFIDSLLSFPAVSHTSKGVLNCLFF